MWNALKNATNIGFIGTPIENSDLNTSQVPGQYVDVYVISQMVADCATVSIYYESRLSTSCIAGRRKAINTGI